MLAALLVVLATLGQAGLSSVTAKADTVTIEGPGDWWDSPPEVNNPTICGNDWWNPDLYYHQFAGNIGDWYWHEYQGHLQFTDHHYARYISGVRNNVSISEIAGGSQAFWDLLGWGIPHSVPMPGSYAANAYYLSLDTCGGVPAQRAFNWSHQADREYYVFTTSMVIRSDAYGWHEVRGAINDKYRELKGWVGWLGIPTTDELRTPNNVGRFNYFQNGAIYWSPATGAHEVHGAILAKWASLGWETKLGFPTTDESVIPGGARSYFQNNCYIDWTPSSGAIAHCESVPGF